jgi:hypothetical protein
LQNFYSQDIQRRCESIVKIVEKEIADIRKAEEEQQKKVKNAGEMQGATVAIDPDSSSQKINGNGQQTTLSDNKYVTNKGVTGGTTSGIDHNSTE